MTTYKMPTVDEIKDLLKACEDIYQPVREQFEEDDKFYELDFKSLLNMPDEFIDEGVVLPTCRDMVNASVDHTDVANARVFVNRKGTSNLSEEEVNMMRKFYLGLINRTNVEATLSPWRTAAKHYWLHGLGVFKTVWDADRWVDKPEQKTGESEESYASRIDEWRHENTQSLPIVIQAVHPYNIMPDPFEDGGKFVFETREKLVYNVKSKYPWWSNPESKPASAKVKCVSLWTPEYRCELYDGEPILKTKSGVVKHNYGFIPYVLIDTGLGNVSYDNDPKKRYVGVLRYIRNLAISESRNYSISDVILKRTAWPWFTIEGTGAEQVTEVSQKFGDVTRLPPDTKVVNQVAQVPPEALNRHLERTSGYISAHAAPNSVRGLGEQGVRSGSDRRLMISEASTRYTYSNEAFKNGTAKVLTNCARLMKNVVPGDIRVWAKTPTDEFDVEIKKDKMTEPFTCYVEFAPINEEDEYRRHDDLERLTQSGITTRKWARTQMSNVDPQAMEMEEEIERLKADPAVAQITSQYLAGKMMEAITKREAAETLTKPEMVMNPGQFMMPGQPPQTGGQPQPAEFGRRSEPPIPNVPVPGSAQNLQNQLANIRSKKPMNPFQGQGGGGNRP